MDRPDDPKTIPVPDWEWWDDDGPSESSMEKMNGGSTTQCPFCNGTGLKNGAPCYSCGGSGWRR